MKNQNCSCSWRENNRCRYCLSKDKKKNEKNIIDYAKENSVSPRNLVRYKEVLLNDDILKIVAELVEINTRIDELKDLENQLRWSKSSTNQIIEEHCKEKLEEIEKRFPSLFYDMLNKDIEQIWKVLNYIFIALGLLGLANIQRGLSSFFG